MAKFLKLENGNYLNVDRITSMYALAGATGWTIEAAGGDGGTVVLGTISSPSFTTEEKAQHFIQQVLGGFDGNSLVDI